MDSPDIWMELTNIPYPYADLAQAFHERRGMDPRLNQSGPSLIVLPEYKPPVYNKGGPTFVTSSIRRSPPEFLNPKIHRNNLLPSILAKIEANAAGADAALMLDRDGFVAEGHGMHVFIVEDNEVSTSHTRACPEGITRQTVLDLCAANGIAHEVRDISTTEVYPADEMSCTGTMGELAALPSVFLVIPAPTSGLQVFLLTGRVLCST